ncbi:hypothetical protein CHCC20335_2395 [Bacillus paralicheniformis]|nr:hypothetical protein CHCC20335_2395 [Bacillus paralicheniformis]
MRSHKIQKNQPADFPLTALGAHGKFKVLKTLKFYLTNFA